MEGDYDFEEGGMALGGRPKCPARKPHYVKRHRVPAHKGVKAHVVAGHCRKSKSRSRSRSRSRSASKKVKRVSKSKSRSRSRSHSKSRKSRSHSRGRK